MNKEFIPYEQSLALKELGFNEKCFGYYYNGELTLNPDSPMDIDAPLYQQAFRWIRENYGMWFEIYPNDTQFVDKATEWFYIIKRGTTSTQQSPYKTQREAEHGCLENLIQIIKNK